MAGEYGYPVSLRTPQVSDKDTAETFAESDVTVTHSQTETAAESVELGTAAGSSTHNTSPDYGTSTSGWWGLLVEPNRDATGITFDVTNAMSYDISKVAIKDHSTGNTLDSVSAVSGDTGVTLSADMSSGSRYRFVCNGGVERQSNVGTPLSYTDFDVVAGWGDGVQDDHSYWLTNLSMTLVAKSGSAYVEWPYPNDIYRWDAATFQKTVDNESVDIYIEEDGGSGWTEIAGPITRGQDISADPSSKCRFRVDLSRASTANNPRLDSVYRRWVV